MEFRSAFEIRRSMWENDNVSNWHKNSWSGALHCVVSSTYNWPGNKMQLINQL